MALSDFDWYIQTVQELYEYMDIKFNVYWPPLKSTINLMTSLKRLSMKLTCSIWTVSKKLLRLEGLVLGSPSHSPGIN